jgi:hypothetical protein
MVAILFLDENLRLTLETGATEPSLYTIAFGISWFGKEVLGEDEINTVVVFSLKGTEASSDGTNIKLQHYSELQNN